MLSPSDFNNAVPQFTNGNYASNPINPQYIAEPDAESYNRGTEPLQTLPAQWWNWFVNKFTARFNKVNIYVKNIFNELAQVLSIFNITPDGTEHTPTTSQLKTVFETCYPQYVKTAANLVGTDTTVNGHPLSSNVTVTRSDLGLGTSATVNTGTAAGCIPTVGTALGTTNNNILVTDSTGKLKPSGITVGTAAGCDATLFARKTEVDALYGNVAGTALGTAAVGTCTTFARSDHVHPMPTCVACAGYLKAFGLNETYLYLSWDGQARTPPWVLGVQNSCSINLYDPGTFCVCHAASASSATSACSLDFSGTSFCSVSANQTPSSYCNSEEGWASYLIFNHGNGACNYHQMIRMPFYGVPQYQDMVNGNLCGWHNFITDENIGAMSVACATNARYAIYATRVNMQTLTQCADCGTHYYYAAGCTFLWAASPIMYWDNTQEFATPKVISIGGSHLICSSQVVLDWNYIDV